MQVLPGEQTGADGRQGRNQRDEVKNRAPLDGTAERQQWDAQGELRSRRQRAAKGRHPTLAPPGLLR